MMWQRNVNLVTGWNSFHHFQLCSTPKWQSKWEYDGKFVEEKPNWWNSLKIVTTTTLTTTASSHFQARAAIDLWSIIIEKRSISTSSSHRQQPATASHRDNITHFFSASNKLIKYLNKYWLHKGDTIGNGWFESNARTHFLVLCRSFHSSLFQFPNGFDLTKSLKLNRNWVAHDPHMTFPFSMLVRPHRPYSYDALMCRHSRMFHQFSIKIEITFSQRCSQSLRGAACQNRQFRVLPLAHCPIQFFLPFIFRLICWCWCCCCLCWWCFCLRATHA